MGAKITDPQQIHAALERHVLLNVEQPAQYVGGELHSVRKDPAAFEVSMALCFPDLYSVGMSYLGYQILYSILNALDWVAAERAYAPWPDMQREMRRRGIPLWTLESFRPLRQFDVVGFSLQSELLLTNVLMMLDLADLPVESAQRGEGAPIVIAGGPVAAAPEPMADFIDLFFIGDAEETIVRFARLLRELKKGSAPREEMILQAARSIPGVYAPAFYEAEYARDGALKGVHPTRQGLAERIRASRVENLDDAPFPTAPIVPFVETVHDRAAVEITRGCTRGCRFCQAGMIHRPARHRSADNLCELAWAACESTGHNEVALASLSPSDYPHLDHLLERLTAQFDPLHVNISLPSLRVSEQLKLLVGPLSRVRKSGLTTAPEAATERLRTVINKDVTEAELFEGAEAAVRQGWRRLKLYFMIGLPTETQQDVLAIPDLCETLLRNVRGGRGSALQLNVTISPFVPKPHTPFQWEPAEPLAILRKRMSWIHDASRSRKIRYKFHDPERSLVEAALARGDRRIGRALRTAREQGAQFDAWDEQFRFDLWREALGGCGIVLAGKGAPDEVGAVNEAPECPNAPFRTRDPDEVLPWDHIDCGVSKEYLLAERKRAFRGEMTPDCREGQCRRCGACRRSES